MFIGIDGTGPPSDAQYYRDMRHSFVHELYRQSRETHRHYVRGPTLLGLETKGTAAHVVKLILRWQKATGDRRIFLSGYSRGGAVCIVAARMLLELAKTERHVSDSIECMALFDAVDRDVFTDSSAIPANVGHVYHALRDPKVCSRWYFGNCGTSTGAPTIFTRSQFYSTHAGMGGMPWTGDKPLRFWGDGAFASPTISKEQDIQGSTKVKEWMWQRLRPHGVVG
jgi:hypothetical protein